MVSQSFISSILSFPDVQSGIPATRWIEYLGGLEFHSTLIADGEQVASSEAFFMQL